MRFAQRLKLVRKELDLKQEDLAQACNVKLTAISKYENEKIKPAFEMLSRIGLAYNVNLNWLINEIGEMFIETAQRKLIKNGSDGFYVEVTDDYIQDIEPKFVSEGLHELELDNDLKVEYYGLGNEKYTKIYHKNGELECSSEDDIAVRNFDSLLEKLKTISKDENLYEFVMTAIEAIDSEEALKELKILIRGMELSKK